jgi:AhpD family alkylhydroperoxidase
VSSKKQNTIMEPRFKMHETLPEVWKAMYALSGSLHTDKITKLQYHLIKVRASQINGCVFCLDMHTKEALHDGETQQRLFLLNAWKESDLYTPEEKAVLAIAEEVTLISAQGLTDATYAQAAAFFDSEAIAQIIMATIIINAWNRIAITTHLQAPKA